MQLSSTRRFVEQGFAYDQVMSGNVYNDVAFLPQDFEFMRALS
jgi:hypothetical protein